MKNKEWKVGDRVWGWTVRKDVGAVDGKIRGTVREFTDEGLVIFVSVRGVRLCENPNNLHRLAKRKKEGLFVNLYGDKGYAYRTYEKAHEARSRAPGQILECAVVKTYEVEGSK